jgi:hypothetical protein
METWATFSITDHRDPVYRRALALFDRIVVPLPPQPIGDQTREELDQLGAELAALQDAGIAVPYSWDSNAFRDWQAPLLKESLSANINRDPYLDTRLMIAEELRKPEPFTNARLILDPGFDLDQVQAIPVYGDPALFAASCQSLMQVDQAMSIEIVQTLPVPDRDTPLQNLIDLRKSPAFRQALDDLLEWKRGQAPAIFLAENRKEAMAAAMRDFDRMAKAYAEAMDAEGFKTISTVGSIFFSVARAEFFGALKETLVSVHESRQPSWKKLSAMKCAPAAIVYQFQHAL